MGIVMWLLTGLVVGLIARFLVPGPQRLGCIGTMLLGIIGSLVGGTLLNALSGDGFELQASGFLGAVFGAMVLLVVGRILSGDRGRRRQRS
ncbi:MAG: GlsB/YeaQ/YmgE family stress response membrane protein [Actinomycetota bacterium]